MRSLLGLLALVVCTGLLACSSPTEPGPSLAPVVISPSAASFPEPGDSMVFTATGGNGTGYNFAVIPNSFDAFEWEQQGANRVKVTRKVYDKYHQPGGTYLLYAWSPTGQLDFHSSNVVFNVAELKAP